MGAVGKGVIVVRGAPDTRDYRAFSQSNQFWYLTGVEDPGAELILVPGSGRQILFLPPTDPALESVEGPRLVPGPEARRRTGIDEVRAVGEFTRVLESLKDQGPFHTPLQAAEHLGMSRDRALSADNAAGRDPWDGRSTRERAFAEALEGRLGAQVVDLSPALDRLRRVKTAEEVVALREACRISGLALVQAMRETRPGAGEWVLDAAASRVHRLAGAGGPAYFPIVGSGPNSCVLHYYRNTRRMAGGEVVLMDYGCEWNHYAADITRTWPVSGKFSARQRFVYQAVLEAQQAAIDVVKPGVTFTEMNRAATRVLADKGLVGAIRHGANHFIGLATHDVGGAGPLPAGAVFTVEPGAYLEREAMGVRIEDVVLVTEDGFEILSAGCPKTIDEIEDLVGAHHR